VWYQINLLKRLLQHFDKLHPSAAPLDIDQQRSARRDFGEHGSHDFDISVLIEVRAGKDIDAEREVRQRNPRSENIGMHGLGIRMASDAKPKRFGVQIDPVIFLRSEQAAVAHLLAAEIDADLFPFDRAASRASRR
jgi:hypothetical protein